MRNSVFGTEKMSSRVDGEQCIPLRGVEVRDEAGVLNARVLNQHVESPKPCDAPFDEIANFILLRHIGLDEMRTGTKLVSCSAPRRCVDIGDNDARAFSDELLRRFPSDIVDS